MEQGPETLPQPTRSSARGEQDPKSQNQQLRREKRNGCVNSARILSSVTRREKSWKQGPSIWCDVQRQVTIFPDGSWEPLASEHRPPAPPGVQPGNAAGFRSPLPPGLTGRSRAMVILYNCSLSLGLGSIPPRLPAAIQTSPVIKWPGHRSSWLRCRGKRLRPPVPGKPGEAKQRPALWAWGSRGGRKASLEAAVASGVQQLASSLLWGRRESQAEGSRRSRGCWTRRPRLLRSLGGAERLHFCLHLCLGAAPVGAEPQEEEETCRQKTGQWETGRSHVGPHPEPRDFRSGAELGFPEAQE